MRLTDYNNFNPKNNIPDAHIVPEHSAPEEALFDPNRLLLSLKKSVFWFIIVFLLSLTGAYLILRYTKPLYRSMSTLKLQMKNDAGEIGFRELSGKAKTLNNLSGEIEIIKSNLIYNKVINVADLKISYFEYGKILTEEKYPQSPFKVTFFDNKNPVIYDKPIDITLLNDKYYLINITQGEKEIAKKIAYGKPVSVLGFKFRLFLTAHFNKNVEGRQFYFIINSKDAQLKYLKENLNVQILNADANTIGISFSDHNKYKAQDLINAIDTIYLNQTLKSKQKAQEQTISFINEQLDKTSDKLSQAEKDLEKFILRSGTADPKNELTRIVAKIEEVESERQQLKYKVDLLNQLEEIIDENTDLEDYIPVLSSFGDSYLTESVRKLDELYAEMTLLKTSTRPNTQAYKNMQIQVESIKQNLKDYLKEYKQVVADEYQMLRENISGLEQQFNVLPSKETEYTRLKRFYNIYEKYYLMLIEKKVEFGIAKAGTIPEFVILSSASLPKEPISPDKKIIYSGGIALSLFLCAGIFALIYFKQNTIISEKEIEQATNVNILGSIPVYNKEKLVNSRLVVHDNPKSLISESLRKIRTNMGFIARDGDTGKIISVTSTISGEGKTFVALNLGGVIALSGKRVVILDLDLRKPKIHLGFNADSEPGMSNLLVGQDILHDCIRPTSLENLNFIPSGSIPPNPSELILKPDFDLILKKLQEIYDVIILDTPPVGLVTDGAIIMRKVDIPIYVMRANYTKKEVGKQLNKMIAEGKYSNLSVILNATTKFSNKGAYGYGYGYSDSGYYSDTKTKPLWKKIFSKS